MPSFSSRYGVGQYAANEGHSFIFQKHALCSPQPPLYTNLSVDPGVESNTTSWTATGTGTPGGATLSRIATIAGGSGSFSLRLTTAAGASTASGQTLAAQQSIAATPGLSYATGIQYVRAGGAPNVRMSYIWRDGGGAQIGGTVTIALVSGVSGRLTGAAVAPAGTATLTVSISEESTGTAQTFDLGLDSLIIVQGTSVPAYFDGSFPGCTWTGTANNSTSISPPYYGRMAIFCHGYSSSGQEPFIDPRIYDWTPRFCTQVGPMMVMDMGGIGTFGNDTAIARITDAYNYVRAQFPGFDPKVNLVGVSQGGPAALNWAAANPTLVNAIAGVIPAVSISDIHDNNLGPGYGPIIEACYTNLAGWNAAKSTHDPLLEPANSWSGIPIKVWGSSTDQIVRPGPVASFVSRVGCEFQDIGTGGHDPLPMDLLDVAEFFSRYP